MTFEELDQSLPNGMHDAEIYDIAVNYVTGSARIGMRFWVGDLGAANQEEYRAGALIVAGLCFLSIDIPDAKCSYLPEGSPLTVSGDLAESNALPGLEALRSTFPPGVSCFRFYVHEWNSFMHVAGRDVQIEWFENTMPHGSPI